MTHIAMRILVVAALLATTASAMTLKKVDRHQMKEVATFQELQKEVAQMPQPKDPCEVQKCKPIECFPPFKFVTKENTGTCCPLCWADDIKVPEDRSWAEGLSGGVPMNPNADSILCRDVVCLKPDCEEFDQAFDGRCCTKCKGSLSGGGAADARKNIEAVAAGEPAAAAPAPAAEEEAPKEEEAAPPPAPAPPPPPPAPEPTQVESDTAAGGADAAAAAAAEQIAESADVGQPEEEAIPASKE